MNALADRTTLRGAASERGMTLLELLVALAIFGVLGSALMPVINGAISSRGAAAGRILLDAEARTILDRLEQDLASNCDVGLVGLVPPRFLAPATTGRFGTSERTVFEATTLVTRGVTSPDAAVGGEDSAVLAAVDRGDQAHVRWSIDDAGRLVRQEIRPPSSDPVDWSIVEVEVMSEHAGLVLEFYEPVTWLEAWDSTESGPHRGRAPVAVRSTLTLDDRQNAPLELVSTVVLPVVQTATDFERRAGQQP
jgi:prepilin-type N-terminal cleavage/methylation domain-containing protein